MNVGGNVAILKTEKSRKAYVMDFKEVMSKHSDTELLKIVTVDKDKYQPSAIEAAQNEISIRGIDNKTIENIKTELFNIDEKQKQFDQQKVGSGKRFVNYIVDTIIWLIIVSILTLPLNAQDSFQMMTGYLILLLTYVGYYYFMEAKFQKTIGKFLTKTTVATIDGQKPTSSDILRRTFCRLIPLDNFSFLFTPNGFHDRLSDTTIIKDAQ